MSQDTMDVFVDSSSQLVSDKSASTLVYPNIQAGHSFSNVLLIDSQVTNYQVFVDSVNASTFPIVYSSTSTKSELTALLQAHFSNIDRIAFCFLGNAIQQDVCLFLDSKPFFTHNNNTGVVESSDENMAWMISTINSFHVKNLDYLACDTLQYSNWTAYYSALTEATGVIVGASDDKTGNIKYGGDWVMESTMENIESVYFAESISYYTYLLDGVYNDTVTNLTYTYVTIGLTASVKATVAAAVPANVTIPNTIVIDSQTYTVTSLADNAFFNVNTLTKITLPSGVTSIGFSAFQSATYLSSITLPSGLISIGSNAFQSAINLTSLTFPASLSSIGFSAFVYTTRLTQYSVDVNNNYFSSDSNGVLFDKPQTRLIDYPIGNTRTSYTVPNTVTTIGNSPFYYATKLKKVTIQSGVTSVGNGLFYGATSLTEVNLPAGLKNIGSSMFYGATSLSGIIIPDSVTSIGAGAFQNASALTNIILPDGLVSIEGAAFQGATSLSSIIIPANVNSLGGYVFQDATKLSSITLPNGISRFGSNLFYNATSLVSITLPDSLTVIASGAFQGASALTKIAIPSGVTVISPNAFQGTTSLTEFTINANNNNYSSDSYGVLFDINKTSLINYPAGNIQTSYTVPSTVASIGASAFIGAMNLEQITIDANNNNYSSDSYGVLFNKNKTILINYPAGNIQTSYTLPSTVTSIGASAFQSATNLEQVTLPANISSIGASAFQGATSLAQITLPANLSSIGASAFQGATSLTQITLPANLSSIGSNVFASTPNLLSITIPAGVTSISASAFTGSGLTSVTFANPSSGLTVTTSTVPNNPNSDLTGTTISSVANNNSLLTSGIGQYLSNLTNFDTVNVTIPTDTTIKYTSRSHKGCLNFWINYNNGQRCLCYFICTCAININYFTK